MTYRVVQCTVGALEAKLNYNALHGWMPVHFEIKMAQANGTDPCIIVFTKLDDNN